MALDAARVRAVEHGLQPVELEAAVLGLPGRPHGLADADDGEPGLGHQVEVALQPVVRLVLGVVGDAVEDVVRKPCQALRRPDAVVVLTHVLSSPWGSPESPGRGHAHRNAHAWWRTKIKDKARVRLSRTASCRPGGQHGVAGVVSTRSCPTSRSSPDELEREPGRGCPPLEAPSSSPISPGSTIRRRSTARERGAVGVQPEASRARRSPGSSATRWKPASWITGRVTGATGSRR